MEFNMDKKYINLLSVDLNVLPWQVENTLGLLEANATIPFISRYRKEATGSLDEVQIAAIKDNYAKYEELDKRREAIIHSINDQGLMTPDLQEKLDKAVTMIELEDLYLPCRPKRKTRASVAKENGLEPLANILLKQQDRDIYRTVVLY